VILRIKCYGPLPVVEYEPLLLLSFRAIWVPCEYRNNMVVFEVRQLTIGALPRVFYITVIRNMGENINCPMKIEDTTATFYKAFIRLHRRSDNTAETRRQL